MPQLINEATKWEAWENYATSVLLAVDCQLIEEQPLCRATCQVSLLYNSTIPRELLGTSMERATSGSPLHTRIWYLNSLVCKLRPAEVIRSAAESRARDLALAQSPNSDMLHNPRLWLMVVKLRVESDRGALHATF